MRGILAFVIMHLAARRSVLVHCWAGKHRSGVFGVLLIALIRGINWAHAEKMYFETRPLPQAWDQSKVQKLGRKHGMPAFLEELRSDGFCDTELSSVRSSILQPKKRPSVKKAARSGVPEKAADIDLPEDQTMFGRLRLHVAKMKVEEAKACPKPSSCDPQKAAHFGVPEKAVPKPSSLSSSGVPGQARCRYSFMQRPTQYITAGATVGIQRLQGAFIPPHA